MQLSRSTIKKLDSAKVVLPDDALFQLPEKVLQFGTGVLLRALPDYFIHKANQQGIFNGRIVVVKSTMQGDAAAFSQQEGLYTLCVRGLEKGEVVEENLALSCISRVLVAQTEWSQVLQCAHDPAMQVIISNTTEVGIQLVPENIRLHPPTSYPGKLLAFLYERYTALGGSAESGMVIIPTELIPNNGRQLEAIILELAQYNKLEDAFVTWLQQCNFFCNSLVDRIVPGAPDAGFREALEKELGYTDELMIMAEAYRLWAIEGNEKVKKILSLAPADAGVVIAPDIQIYRELKLRLLNGTHTLSCGLAYLARFQTVKEAMEDAVMEAFIAQLMQQELAPAIPYQPALPAAPAFAHQVLDRFRNPFLQHQWINITLQYSSKMKLRCVPLLLQHYAIQKNPPPLFALGFAAYLLFMKPVKEAEGVFYGAWQGVEYKIQDERAPLFYTRWKNLQVPELVQEVLADTAYWEADLTSLPHFYNEVLKALESLIQYDVKEITKAAIAKNR